MPMRGVLLCVLAVAACQGAKPPFRVAARREQAPPGPAPEGCEYQPQQVDSGEPHFGGDFRRVDGVATRPAAKVGTAATLRLDLDRENAVVMTPTGIPGPRQTCRAYASLPYALVLELADGSTLRARGRMEVRGFEVQVAHADEVTVSEDWTGSDDLVPDLLLSPTGEVSGSIQDRATREPVLHFSSL